MWEIKKTVDLIANLKKVKLFLKHKNRAFIDNNQNGKKKMQKDQIQGCIITQNKNLKRLLPNKNSLKIMNFICICFKRQLRQSRQIFQKNNKCP